MNCPNCESIVPVNKKHCERCGEDVTIYRRVIHASNMLYNQALAKTTVRDLTGAVTDLAKSLKLNKKNTKARNLLGLIYYEMGEVVDALSEWVLSKHFQSKENDADGYIKAIQSNPTKLDTINQAIKKYNGALLSAKQRNDDLAIIQLKKVTSLNTHFIRAYHLLALLYMKNNEYEKARKILQKVSKIDVNNTTTLRYLKELVSNSSNENVSMPYDNYTGDNKTIIPISSYKEDKPNIFVFVNLVLGIVIGIAVVYYLFVPTIKKDIAAEYNTNKIDYSEQMSAQTSTIATLEGDKEELQVQIDELQKKVADFEIGEYDAAQYDALFEATTLYMNNDKEGAANVLVDTKVDKIESEVALNLYNLMKEDTFKDASVNLYNTGHAEYSSGKYEDAIKTLEKAVTMDETNVNALYFMGRSYHRLGDNTNAALYYNKVVDEYPETTRASEAKERLKELNQ